MTPRTTASPDRISRSLRESRLFSVALIIDSAPTPARVSSRFMRVQHALGGRVAQLVDDAAVGEEDDPVGVAGGVGVVGHHHHGLAELAHRLAQEAQYLRAASGSRGCRSARRRR